MRRAASRLGLGVGRALRELGAISLAQRTFRLAARDRRVRSVAAYYIGRCHEGRADRAAARRAYREALAAGPSDARLARRIGHALRRMGEIGPAFRAFERANDLEPDDFETVFHLGLCQEDLGHTAAAHPWFVAAGELRPDDARARAHMRVTEPRDLAIPDRLHFVILGTIGACNASCVHCPTGKARTRHVPRTPMPMPLFRKIIDGIADAGMPVLRQLAFGLFGDALLDPHVLERARYVRERLPDVALSVNTNGAAYDPAKHAGLEPFVSIFALHCESLDPATYDDLMRPLKAERVHAKFPRIFEDFPGKVQVACPLSRRNLKEREAIDGYFRSLGARHVDFAPLANRCARDDSLFESLAFDPRPVRCEPGIVYNLIVDCDGTVVACCNDFEREVPLGSFAEQSFEEVLASAPRLAMRERLACGEHESMPTCKRCRGDTANPPLVQAHELQGIAP